MELLQHKLFETCEQMVLYLHAASNLSSGMTLICRSVLHSDVFRK